MSAAQNDRDDATSSQISRDQHRCVYASAKTDTERGVDAARRRQTHEPVRRLRMSALLIGLVVGCSPAPKEGSTSEPTPASPDAPSSASDPRAGSAPSPSWSPPPNPPASTAPAGSEPPSSTCETAGSAPLAADDHGTVPVRALDGTTHRLYWMRLPAPSKPARATLFYLAGGPLSHLGYAGLAGAFQRLAYPDLDVVLYDYFGFNCSTLLGSVGALEPEVRGLGVAAMAADFHGLKRALVGDTKVLVMGGSHGAMLGAEILAAHPEDLAQAILFSGDTQSGWLADGWFRFDALVARMADATPAFARDLEALLERARRGELAVELDGVRRVVDRPALEVALWLAAGLSSKVQAALSELVRTLLGDDRAALGRLVAAERGLLAPPGAATPPTDTSAVTTFHRCNVWFPKSTRAAPDLLARPTRYFAFASFAAYWNELCEAYDRLGEHPFRAVAQTPSHVPVLAWVGDQDTFDPEATRARLSALTNALDFTVMPGFAHDFGRDENAGFLAVAQKIERFLAAHRAPG